MADTAIERDVCGASSRQTGKPCQKPAGWGTPFRTGRCSLHGGATPSHIQKAERERLIAAAQTMGIPVDVDPHEALLSMLATAYGAQAYLGLLVADLERGELSGPVGGAQGGHPSFEPNVLIRMWQDERDRVAKVAKLCADAGVEERRTRVAEGQGREIAERFRTLLARLGLDQGDPRVQEAVRKALLEPIDGTARELPGGRA